MRSRVNNRCWRNACFSKPADRSDRGWKQHPTDRRKVSLRISRNERSYMRRYTVQHGFRAQYTCSIDRGETVRVLLAFNKNKRTISSIFKRRKTRNRTRCKLRITKSCTGEISYIANREFTRRREKNRICHQNTFFPEGVTPREKANLLELGRNTEVEVLNLVGISLRDRERIVKA